MAIHPRKAQLSALALLALVTPGAAPRAAAADGGTAQEIEVLPDLPVPVATNERWLRLAMGAGVMQDAPGVSPLVDFSYVRDAWRRAGVRVNLGLALGTGWTALDLAPSFVLRGADAGARLTPYLAAGPQLSAISVNSDLPSSTTRRLPLPMRAGPLAAGSPGEGPLGATERGGGIGAAPFRFFYGPQATAGVLLRIASDVFVDVGARYELRVYRGNAHHGGGATLGVFATL